MNLSLDQILSDLNHGLSIYEHYYPQFTGGRPLGRLNTKMISPFERSQGIEKDASFSIYMHRTKGYICYKDHGIERQGSPWQFVMDLFGIDFKDAVKKVKCDLLGIGEGVATAVPSRVFDYPKVVIRNTRVEITPTLRGWNDVDEEYWGKSGISLETADLFHCAPANHFEIKKEDKTIRVHEKPGSPIYNFAFPSGRQKMLQPYAEPQYKWTSNLKADEDIFGFHLIPKQCDDLFMIGGNKDTMSFFENIGLKSFGAFALASESANLTEELFHFLRRIAKNIWCFYDNDAQGYRKAEKFKEEFGIENLNSTLSPFNVKDFGQLMEEKSSMLPEFKKIFYQNINKTDIL